MGASPQSRACERGHKPILLSEFARGLLNGRIDVTDVLSFYANSIEGAASAWFNGKVEPPGQPKASVAPNSTPGLARSAPASGWAACIRETSWAPGYPDHAWAVVLEFVAEKVAIDGLNLEPDSS